MFRKQRYHDGICRITYVMLFISAALMLSGCFEDVGKDAVKQAVGVIQNGIDEIHQDSASWQMVLQQVAKQLPEGISETVRVDAQNLVSRSIATGGTEFRCNAGFLGDRAIQSLQRLKAVLLKKNPPPVPPSICQVVPPSIELSNSPEEWSTVTLYGYDLDHRDRSNKQLGAFLLNRNDQTQPLPENRIGRTTHYQITLNLGNMARQLYTEGVTKILIAAKDAQNSYSTYSEIVVVPWQPSQKRLHPISITGPYTPPHIGDGDADFNTHHNRPTKLQVQGVVRIDTSHNAVQGRVYMWAREVAPDHTEVKGSKWYSLAEADPGWRIISVNPGKECSLKAQITEHQPAGGFELHCGEGEVVDYFTVWLDREGEEAGTYSRVTVHWRQLNIQEVRTQPDFM